ncbi:MAG: hypothetical protein ACYSUP_01240 [Planctomycetota bacterium]
MKRIGYLLAAVMLLTFVPECLGNRLSRDSTVQFVRETDKGSADANAPVTLQDYLRLAALNNAGLKAAFEEWKAARPAVYLWILHQGGRDEGRPATKQARDYAGLSLVRRD